MRAGRSVRESMRASGRGSAHVPDPTLPVQTGPLAGLLQSMPNAVLETSESFGQPRARIDAARAREALRFARDKDSLAFDALLDLTAVPRSDEAGGLDLVYRLSSSAHGHRLRLVVGLAADDREIDSVADLWPVARPLEQEVTARDGVRFRHQLQLRGGAEADDA